MFKNKLIFISILILFILTIGFASANENITEDTIQTDDTDSVISSNDYKTIQNEINKVEENGNVTLNKTTYTPSESEKENFTSIDIMDKSLNLIGDDDKTTINGDGIVALNIGSSEVLVKNIIFSNAFGAVEVFESNVTFENCEFLLNHNSVGGAVCIESSNANFINCVFKDNLAKGDEASVGGAIAILNANGYETNIVNSTFINNTAVRGGAIYIAADSSSKRGNLNILNSIFKQNNVYMEDMLLEDDNAAADISFYNPTNNKLITVDVEIENTTFNGVDSPDLVDREHPSLYLANEKNSFINCEFENNVIVGYNKVNIEFDDCNLNNIASYSYNKKGNLVSGEILYSIKNSDISNSFLDTGAGSIENSNIRNSSISLNSEKNFSIKNSSFTNNSEISLENGNIVIADSDLDDSSVYTNHYSKNVDKVNLKFKNSSFSNLKLDVPSSKTTFDNCSGLDTILKPVYIYGKFSATYKSGKTITFMVMNSNDDTALKNFKVTLSLYKSGSDKLISESVITTKANGNATFKVPKTLAAGVYSFNVTLGDDAYYYNDLGVFLNVNKIKTTVSAPKVVSKIKKSKYFKATVKVNKKPLKNIKVKVKVYTGKKYKVYNLKTNKKGVVKLNTKSLKKGTHKVVISSGNANYKISKTSSIKIN